MLRKAAPTWRPFLCGTKFAGEKRTTLIRNSIILTLLICFTVFGHAQIESTTNGAAIHSTTDNPVAQVREARSWEMGPFINWGTGLGDRSDFKFLWGGFELGKTLTPVLHAGILSGQFQLAGNVMPLWQAYTPAPHDEIYTCLTPLGQVVSCTLPVGGG